MEGYSFWLLLLAVAILSASIMQMQTRAGRRLAMDCRRLKSEIDLLQGRLREKEARNRPPAAQSGRAAQMEVAGGRAGRGS